MTAAGAGRRAGSAAGALVLLLVLQLVAACSHPAPPAGGAAGAGADAEEPVLNVYSWAEYIAPGTVADFEKETGIKVHYDVYDNNEVLETKLLTGHSNYDIVVPTENFFARQVQAGVYRRLDKHLLPNLRNTDPDIMRRLAVHDPGNEYAIPYMWSTTGLGYNTDMVQARIGTPVPDGWGLLFDPRNAARLKDCGIFVIDSPLDVIQSAIIYLHRDPNRHEPEDVRAAEEVLRRIRPYVRIIDPTPIPNLANGEVCLALAWSGDVEAARNRAAESGTGAHIAYLIPAEGALITVDAVAIPADAPHPRNAALWMNYLLRPEVVARISNYVKYPNGVRTSLPYVDASVREDPAVYPDARTRERLVTNSSVPINYTRLITRAWTRFRTGQ